MSDSAVRDAWRNFAAAPSVSCALAWIRASVRAGGWPLPGRHELADGLHERAPILFLIRKPDPFPGQRSECHEPHDWPTSPRNRGKRNQGRWWWPMRQVTSAEWIECHPACEDGTLVRLRRPLFVLRAFDALAHLEERALDVAVPLPAQRPVFRCACCESRSVTVVARSGLCRRCVRAGYTAAMPRSVASSRGGA